MYYAGGKAVSRCMEAIPPFPVKIPARAVTRAAPRAALVLEETENALRRGHAEDHCPAPALFRRRGEIRFRERRTECRVTRRQLARLVAGRDGARQAEEIKGRYCCKRRKFGL